MRKYAPLLFALLLLVSCSEADTGAPSSAPSVDRLEAEVGDGDEEREEGSDEGERSKKKRTGSAEDNEPARERPGSPGDDAAVPGSDADNDTAAGPFNDSGAEDDNSSAVYPAAGNYVFAQSGFEKFCAGGRCEKQALPKRQTARLALRERSRERAIVVTETSASDDRMLRTTTTYSPASALITDVYTRLSYEGFVFENEYHPAPPVESLRFPLEDGATWEGSWKDSTSGDYAVRVFGPASVSVAGRAVRAWQVATTTEFRGEFTGEAKTISWIDPATKAIVKLNGSVDLTSTYGRYVTEFSTTLRSGPGY